MLRIRHVRTGRGRCCSSLLHAAAALCCMRVWHATHLLLNYFCCCCCCCTCCSSCCCNVEIVAKLQIFSQRLRSLTPAPTHCCLVVVAVVVVVLLLLLLLCFWCTWNAVTNDFSTIIYIIFDYLLPFIDFAISFALFTFATSRCCCCCYCCCCCVVSGLTIRFHLQPKMEIYFAVFVIDLFLIWLVLIFSNALRLHNDCAHGSKLMMSLLLLLLL